MKVLKCGNCGKFCIYSFAFSEHDKRRIIEFMFIFNINKNLFTFARLTMIILLFTMKIITHILAKKNV